MKIYFNRSPVAGPWGGGSKVLASIVDECKSRNYETFFENDIHNLGSVDVIFCIDPRPHQNVDFSLLLWKKLDTKARLIQRVGDLGTHGKPDLTNLVVQTCQFSDHVIFPSTWARDTLLEMTSAVKRVAVIDNAPLPCFISNYEKKDFINTIKIVTHHWSNNAMKGFDIYEQLDEFCHNSNEKFEFTFIGRKPENINFKNYIGPKDANELVDLLSRHHIYVTASKFEAGANHVLEAIGMKLPVLYHSAGGSIVNYCKDYGLLFNNFDNLAYHLKNNVKELENISKRMNFDRTTLTMAKEYVDLFEKEVG